MTVAEKLTHLAELYQAGLTTPFLEQQLNKLLKREAEECRRQLGQLDTRLTALEARYHESTLNFWQRWQAGQTTDSLDFTEWASLAQARVFLQKRLALLGD